MRSPPQTRLRWLAVGQLLALAGQLRVPGLLSCLDDLVAGIDLAVVQRRLLLVVPVLDAGQHRVKLKALKTVATQLVTKLQAKAIAGLLFVSGQFDRGE